MYGTGPDRPKLPVVVSSNGSATVVDAHNPDNWRTFDEAVAIAKAGPEKYGIGFDLFEGSGFVGLDIDDCIDDAGEIDATAQELLRIADSYAEISPSGHGLRIFGYGEPLTDSHRKFGKLPSDCGIERYSKRRFLTITGNGAPVPMGDLGPLQELLEANVYKRAPSAPPRTTSGDTDFDVAAVLYSLPLLGQHRCDEYLEWFKVGSALAEFGDCMADAYLRWSSGSDKFDADSCRKKWDHLIGRSKGDTNKGFGTITAMAVEDSGRSIREILADVQRKLGRGRNDTLTVKLPRGMSLPQDDRPIDEIELPPPSRLAYRDFPADALPEPLRAFVMHGAAALCCDPGTLSLFTLVTASAAIGTTRRITIKRTWRPYPILWGVLVAQSGDLKTPIFELATQPIRDRQARLKQQHAAEKEAFEQALAEWKDSRAKAKDGDVIPPKPEEPMPMPRMMTADATVEALGSLLEANPRGMFVGVDELCSLMGGMDRYKRGTGDEGFFLSSYGGLSHTIDRKTGEPKSTFIPRCALQIVSGVQPARAQGILDKDRRASGFVQRLLFCYPPRRAYRWSDAEASGIVLHNYAVLIERLYALGDGFYEPESVAMHDEARRAFIAWTREHSRHCRNFSPDLAAAASKLREIPARLALILHLVDVVMGRAKADAPVSPEAMSAAISISRWFRHEAERVFRMLEADTLELGELLAVDAAGAGILETLWDAEEPMSREEIAEALSPTPPAVVVSALADLLHRGAATRSGEGTDERWQSSPPEPPAEPEAPALPEFDAWAPKPFEWIETPGPEACDERGEFEV
jgi:hypothetical protein